MNKKRLNVMNRMKGLPEYYEDTIDDFLRQGGRIPTPEEFIMNCYDDGMFDNEELSAWFEDPEDPSDEEMNEFIEDVVDHLHLYRVLAEKEEAMHLRNEANSRNAILKKELNKIYRKLESEYISNGERDYLEDKKDYILEQLGVSKNIKDSLDKRQRNILAKRILNCYSDKELLDIIYELIDWDNKLFDKAMDIYEENGSVQYRAKKISDLLTY